MKVRELMNKACLYEGQKTKLHDSSTQMNFEIQDGHVLGLGRELDSDEVERLLKLNVHSLTVSDKGLNIWAV